MRLLTFCILLVMSTSVFAGPVEVLEAKALRSSDGSYRFDVTLKHADTGWKHYADKWDVVLPDGSVLATRTLFHPHVEEQPFTRSLGKVMVPALVEFVVIRGHDSKHGYGSVTKRVMLPKS